MRIVFIIENRAYPDDIEISKLYLLQSLRFVFIIENSAYRDDMTGSAAFNLGFHYFSEHSFSGLQYIKG